MWSMCHCSGSLWFTGNSLREKLLSSLVSAIAAWLCLSHTNWAAFCQSLAFILLFFFIKFVHIRYLKVPFYMKNVYVVIFVGVYICGYISSLQITLFLLFLSLC